MQNVCQFNISNGCSMLFPGMCIRVESILFSEVPDSLCRLFSLSHEAFSLRLLSTVTQIPGECPVYGLCVDVGPSQFTHQHRPIKAAAAAHVNMR